MVFRQYAIVSRMSRFVMQLLRHILSFGNKKPTEVGLCFICACNLMPCVLWGLDAIDSNPSDHAASSTRLYL